MRCMVAPVFRIDAVVVWCLIAAVPGSPDSVRRVGVRHCLLLPLAGSDDHPPARLQGLPRGQELRFQTTTPPLLGLLLRRPGRLLRATPHHLVRTLRPHNEGTLHQEVRRQQE
uniref:Secreted protein n=1 Tax=Timema monikensis TaxID=170555 RepID=A0A7R9HL91_9NEOP|nr:unnamed protein product [Timema monikensis]